MFGAPCYFFQALGVVVGRRQRFPKGASPAECLPPAATPTRAPGQVPSGGSLAQPLGPWGSCFPRGGPGGLGFQPWNPQSLGSGVLGGASGAHLGSPAPLGGMGGGSAGGSGWGTSHSNQWVSINPRRLSLPHLSSLTPPPLEEGHPAHPPPPREPLHLPTSALSFSQTCPNLLAPPVGRQLLPPQGSPWFYEAPFWVLCL